MTRDVFRGEILSVGTSSGTRMLVGRWDASPFGPFADLMIESADGHRVLVSPTRDLERYVDDIYVFDERRIERVRVLTGPGRWAVETDRLHLEARIGGRTPLGHVLRAVPRPVAERPWFSRLTDPVAKTVLAGVRTRGRGPLGGRRWYAAHDMRRLTGVTAFLDGRDLGPLAGVDPWHVGFGSTPAEPALLVVTSIVERVWRTSGRGN